MDNQQEIADIKTNTENDWIRVGPELICQGNGSYFHLIASSTGENSL